MSTNSECSIIEVSTNKWFYILEDYNAPKNAWDWREHASAYGPFPSEEAAIKHLDDNHANPGGFGTSPLPQGVTTRDLDKDATLKALIEGASAPRARSRAYGGMRW